MSDGTKGIEEYGFTFLPYGFTANYFAGLSGSPHKFGGYRTSFIPVMFQLTLSEALGDIATAMQTLAWFVPLVFPGVAINFVYRNTDRGAAFTIALASVQPAVHRALDCFPHLSGAKGIIPRHMGKLNDKSKDFVDGLEADIGRMHLARTHRQHEILAKIFIMKWRKAKECLCAIFFQTNYCVQGKNNWFYAASGMPGVETSNQPIELFMRTAKLAMLGKRHAHKLGHLLTSVLPTFIRDYGLEATRQKHKIGNTVSGPIPVQWVEKAVVLTKEYNFIKIKSNPFDPQSETHWVLTAAEIETLEKDLGPTMHLTTDGKLGSQAGTDSYAALLSGAGLNDLCVDEQGEGFVFNAPTKVNSVEMTQHRALSGIASLVGRKPPHMRDPTKFQKRHRGSTVLDALGCFVT